MSGDGALEKRSALLQLADRRARENESDTRYESTGASSTGAPPGYNVITQVTTRESPAHPLPSLETPQRKSSGWRSRIQTLFCCFTPQTSDQYYRPEPEAVVIRPPQPPVPPSHIGEAVIGPIQEQDFGKKTLVLDLDETLVHSSFKPISNPDYIIPVEIEGKTVDVYVLKRPLMDDFLAAVGANFEIVVFTASLSKYADPLLDLLDPKGVVRWRLFRESCYPYEGNYVKNLLCLGRNLADVIIVDNSPHSYVFQPDNALPIGTFIDDPEDTELAHTLHVLRAVERVRDVRQHLGHLITAMQSSSITNSG